MNAFDERERQRQEAWQVMSLGQLIRAMAEECFKAQVWPGDPDFRNEIEDVIDARFAPQGRSIQEL